jgi:hypothetical protein
MDIYEQRNIEVRNWDRENISLLRSEIDKLGIKKYSGAFLKYLKSRYYFNQFKDIRGIGYKMPRHAIYVHKGVGRGYGIKSTTTQQLGGKKRQPKEWFNPVMNNRIPVLASAVAKADADIIADNLFIK